MSDADQKDRRPLSRELREAQQKLDAAVREEAAAFAMYSRSRLNRSLAASAVLALQEQMIDALRTV